MQLSECSQPNDGHYRNSLTACQPWWQLPPNEDEERALPSPRPLHYHAETQISSQHP